MWESVAITAGARLERCGLIDLLVATDRVSRETWVFLESWQAPDLGKLHHGGYLAALAGSVRSTRLKTQILSMEIVSWSNFYSA